LPFGKKASENGFVTWFCRGFHGQGLEAGEYEYHAYLYKARDSGSRWTTQFIIPSHTREDLKRVNDKFSLKRDIR
jgi:hypothetical protein